MLMYFLIVPIINKHCPVHPNQVFDLAMQYVFSSFKSPTPSFKELCDVIARVPFPRDPAVSKIRTYVGIRVFVLTS